MLCVSSRFSLSHSPLASAANDCCCCCCWFFFTYLVSVNSVGFIANEMSSTAKSMHWLFEASVHSTPKCYIVLFAKQNMVTADETDKNSSNFKSSPFQSRWWLYLAKQNPIDRHTCALQLTRFMQFYWVNWNSETIEIEKEKNATKWCVMATTVAAAVEVSTSFDLNEYSFYSIEVS